MVSFDVESLYTNTPIADALLVIKDLLNNDTTLQDRTNLLPDQILELLEFLLRTTFFIFNGEFRQQTDGVAMGGPASSIVAEIYMISIETTAITTADTPPRIWERHVDDVFSILRRCNLEQFFQHINSLHPKTKFTMETEYKSLPLLSERFLSQILLLHIRNLRQFSGGEILSLAFVISSRRSSQEFHSPTHALKSDD